MIHFVGGLAQRADVGAEVSHSAASVSHHSGGLREQLAGRKYLKAVTLNIGTVLLWLSHLEKTMLELHVGGHRL